MFNGERIELESKLVAKLPVYVNFQSLEKSADSLRIFSLVEPACLPSITKFSVARPYLAWPFKGEQFLPQNGRFLRMGRSDRWERSLVFLQR